MSQEHKQATAGTVPRSRSRNERKRPSEPNQSYHRRRCFRSALHSRYSARSACRLPCARLSRCGRVLLPRWARPFGHLPGQVLRAAASSQTCAPFAPYAVLRSPTRFQSGQSMSFAGTALRAANAFQALHSCKHFYSTCSRHVLDQVLVAHSRSRCKVRHVGLVDATQTNHLHSYSR